MALTIQTEKGIFDLPQDFSVEIENTSPMYTDKGSQTIASTLPATGHNLSMVDYIHRPDIRNAPKRDAAAVVTDGVYRRTGKLNITSVSTESGIVCNIGFDESIMYEAWKNVSLKELPGLPVIKYPEGVAALARHLEEVMRYQTPADYHVFRIQVASETLEETEYPEFINPIGSDGKTYALLKEARTERVVISGQAVDVKVPAGYGISPFLKVSRILEMIFSAYGFTLVENPFATDYQLSKMVVLNNVADTIVTGEIDYRNLMPDCTVNEFLDALFCRTGAKVYVNAGRKAVIRLLKDSIGATASADWTPLKASEPEINYTPAKQLKLSAGTSFKEAEPAADSFEKFLKPYGGIITEFTGDRDVPDELYITYQPSTGRYYKRDIVNKKKKWISSDFFPWDKGTPGVEYLEISKYSINSLVYWVTYVHNVVYSFYRSMIYCYINSTQRCAGSIVIDIIPTNGADKRKFFPFAPYFPVTNVIKRYFYPYFPAIIGIKGYSFPYFPYLSGIMKIKTALYSLFSRLDWHKTVVFPCLGEIYEGIRSLSWEIPVT